jgi:hypothetical protein
MTSTPARSAVGIALTAASGRPVAASAFRSASLIARLE